MRDRDARWQAATLSSVTKWRRVRELAELLEAEGWSWPDALAAAQARLEINAAEARRQEIT